MDSNDRQAIEGLFAKLGDIERQAGPRDAEAEHFIADSLSRQPGAPYYMAQTIVMQEMAITNQQKRIEELERAAQTAAALPGQVPATSPASPLPVAPPAASTAPPVEPEGMFSRIFGGGSRSSVPSVGGARPVEPRPGGVWGNAGNAPQPGDPNNQPGYSPQGRGFGGGFGGGMGGGGFLAGAAQTAMGVAGGVMLGNALGGLFGGHEAKAAEATPASAPEPAPAAEPDDKSADTAADDSADRQDEPQLQDASADDGGWFGGDDGSFDDGGFEDI